MDTVRCLASPRACMWQFGILLQGTRAAAFELRVCWAIAGEYACHSRRRAHLLAEIKSLDDGDVGNTSNASDQRLRLVVVGVRIQRGIQAGYD